MNVNGPVVNVEDINAGVAADLAVQACGIDVGPLAVGVLARAVAGPHPNICRADQGLVTISQT